MCHFLLERRSNCKKGHIVKKKLFISIKHDLIIGEICLKRVVKIFNKKLGLVKKFVVIFPHAKQYRIIFVGREKVLNNFKSRVFPIINQHQRLSKHLNQRLKHHLNQHQHQDLKIHLNKYLKKPHLNKRLNKHLN